MLRRRTSRAAASAPAAASLLNKPPPFTLPSPRELFSLQYRVLLWKDLTLRKRYWKFTTCLAIIVPIVIPAILFIAQHMILRSGAPGSSAPTTWPLEDVRQCVPRKSARIPCITLAYTPKTPEVDKVITAFVAGNARHAGAPMLEIIPHVVSDDFVPQKPLGVVPLRDESTMYSLALKSPEALTLGVAFAIVGSSYQYRIYYNFTEAANMTVMPHQNKLNMRDAKFDDAFGQSVLSLMRGLDEAIITVNDPSNLAQLDFKLRAFPDIAGRSQYASNKDIVWSFASMLLFLPGTFISIAFLTKLAREKEQKLRQNMELMGLNSIAYWIAHFLSAMTMVFVQSLILCLVGLAFGLSFFSKANFLAVILMFNFFGIAMIAFFFFLSTLVSSVREGVVAGFAVTVFGLIYQLLAPSFWYSLYVNIEKSKLGVPYQGETIGWVIGMFFPFFNFNQLYIDINMKTIGANDPLTGVFRDGGGFTLKDLFQTPRVGGNLYPGLVPLPFTSLMLLIMNFVFFVLLGWYLDHVIPNDQGFRRPLLFFLQPGYWGRKDSTNPQGITGRKTSAVVQESDLDLDREQGNAMDSSYSAVVRVVNLCKSFASGTFRRVRKKAVDRLFLTIGDGELLVLLGQNGAGKSTTMSMLYGTTQVTSGDVTIFGMHVTSAMSDIRKSLGVCVQNDCLFLDMTATEHIYLYAGIKGYPVSQRAQLAKSLLAELRLDQYANVNASEYSGGMKRRLSLLLATIGEPRFLILDEPTSGMDPVTRKFVWEYVDRIKVGRAILLSTHSLEEADVVGDRIAVMSRGRLLAIGTSSHIKNRYGAGYRLTVSVRSRKDALVDIMRRILPEAQLGDETDSRVRFRVPGTAKRNLANTLKYLEDNPHGIISTWSISQSTLEDIFLRLMEM